MTSRSRLLFFSFTAVLLATGCRRDTIRVYLAPKDQPSPAQLAEPSRGHGSGPIADQPSSQENRVQQPRPKLSWTLPPGWIETEAGEVSTAQFTTKNDAGETNVNITQLFNLKGKEALVVNMWREQVGQPPLEQEELATALTPVDVAGGKGQLFEITGTRKGVITKIVTAMLHQDDVSWFFKLAGSEAGVAAQKPVFMEFLKSVRIGGPETAAQPVPETEAQP